MRCTVFVGVSVDGFIARPDGGIDWLPDDCEPHGFEELFAAVDAIVLGRKTYETVLGFGGWVYGSKPVVVLTSRPDAITPPPGAVCEAMGGTPREIVDRLEARGMRELYIDGGVTVQRFLEAGLIQRLIVTRIPVLIGSGIPLFGPLSRDVHLAHVATRTYRPGLVQSEYRIGE